MFRRSFHKLDFIQNKSVYFAVILYYFQGKMESIANVFDSHFSLDFSDLQSLSMLHPRIYVHVFALANVADFQKHRHLFYPPSSK